MNKFLLCHCERSEAISVKHHCHCERSEAISVYLMKDKCYYVYILTNKHDGVLYIGVTNNIVRRIWEHREKLVDGFTKKYNLNKLVYYEMCEEAYNAISREKQLKAGSRKKKVDLINSINPKWDDLYEEIASVG